MIEAFLEGRVQFGCGSRGIRVHHGRRHGRKKKWGKE